MGRNWTRLGGENSRSQGVWEGSRQRDASRTAGGRGFVLAVWLLGKLQQRAPDVSGPKKAAPGENKPGWMHPELEFTF